MKNSSIQKKDDALREALKTENKAKVKKILGEVLDTKLTQEEEGEVLTQVTESYIKMTNEVQTAYLETLDTAIEALKKIQEDEKKAEEIIKKETVRKQLQEIDDLD